MNYIRLLIAIGSSLSFWIFSNAALYSQTSAKLVFAPKDVGQIHLLKDDKSRDTDSQPMHFTPLVLTQEKIVKADDNVSNHLGYVRSLDRTGKINGWIDLSNVAMIDDIGRAPRPQDGTGRSKSLNVEVPAEISRLSPTIVAAWLEVQRAISENESLNQPLAEPYFARAEILTLAKDFDSALIDYLRAMDIASRSKDESFAYAAYFQRLRDALENYDKEPRQPASGSASSHFGEGVHSYREDDFETAKKHFTNAIALDSSKPLYWYYRALAYKQLGDDRRAKHDALIGAHVEWRRGERAKIGSSLAWVQGDLRLWLESYRLGDPTRQLLQ